MRLPSVARFRQHVFLVAVNAVVLPMIACFLGFVCKRSRSPWLRKRIGVFLNRMLGEHFSQLVEPPDSQSPAAVAHEFSNVTILGCMRYAIHGPEDDLFEQNITVTIVRTADAVIVYNPIPLSKAQMREHLPDAARERAERDIDEMRSMIRDTLAFARGEASDGEGALVDLSSLLDSLAEDMRVGGSDVAVETGARMVVRGDPQALRRAFTNLVGNAIRYGDRACVRARPDGNRAVVTVEDDGPGIDPLQAERLFEPFVRGEASRNRATGGTGLGLAIVRSVAARHGGTVSLANRPGGGGIATVTLPLAR